MPDEACAITISRTDRGAVIELAGTVNRAAKEGLEAGYRDATRGSGDVLLDFSDVDYINSAGIAVIVGILAMARADGREVGACGLSDHYQELFRIARLTDHMAIYEDAAAARTAGWDRSGTHRPPR